MTNAIVKESQRCLSAIELMHQVGVVPDPRNYELFYLYAGKSDPALTRSLDEIIAAGGTMPQGKADELYERHVQTAGTASVLEKVGDLLSTKLTEAIGLVNDAAKSSSSFQVSLGDAGSRLIDLSDPKKLAAVVESLVVATQTMGQANLELEQRLKSTSSEVSALKNDLSQVRQDSQVDALTGIGNRRYLDTVLATEITRAGNRSHPLSFCLLDIDHFKTFNDTYGHTAGDAALRGVAGLLKDNIREDDFAARFGGEEFAIILPATTAEEAAIVVERVRKAFASKQIKKRSTGEVMGTVTASFGIAQFEAGNTMEALIERADNALYAAKNAGRNRVIICCTSDDGTGRPNNVVPIVA